MKNKVTVFAVMGILAIFAILSVDAQSFSLTNKFGGDSDDISSEDFLTFTKGDDDEFDGGDVKVSDRLQFDFSSEKLDGRLRMEYQSARLNGRQMDGDDKVTRFRGFMRFRPIQEFGIAAGNEFFTKYAVSASYLAAADDNPKDGRMAENGFAAILDVADLRVVANLGGKAFDESDEISVNLGFDYEVENLVTFGAAFKNVSNDNLGIGAFVGLLSVENLIFNAGFLYNATDTDFITDAAEMAVSVTAGYEFTDMRLGLFADFMMGLTGKYLEDGDTVDYADDANPLFIRGRAVYGITDALAFNLDATFGMWTAGDYADGVVVYPYLTYDLPDFGSLKAGVRMCIEDGDMNTISIPLVWEYKLVSK